MDKLTFRVPRPVRPAKEKQPVIRITADAYNEVERISAMTGLSNSFVASRMIEFAAQHSEVILKENDEDEE